MSSLNTEQTAALMAVRKGLNIFLTGAGGTGKSHTIRAIRGLSANTAVTAMTGCAALLLNYDGKAKTLHSWAGVGLARDTPQQLVVAIESNRKAKRRWLDTRLLIIDEVSMMTPDFLEKLDHVARAVRKQPTAKFGGLQVVFAGDFCQLPPVSSSKQFVFQSPLWTTLIDETHNLTQIVRQPDPVFQRVLTEARMGALSPESIAILEGRKGLPWQDNEIKPTLLYARNTDVDRINRANMESLEGERRTYTVNTVTKAGGRLASPDIQRSLAKLDADAPYDVTLELCVGAQVMLLTNMDQGAGLVNGSRGVVTGYSASGLPMVRFIGGRDPVVIERANWWLAEPDTIGRTQIPLKIAYAITIHKSQGATLDSALIDIGSSTFEYGQAYVALSRCRSLDGLYIWRMNERMILCHPAVREFYASLPTLTVSPLNDDGVASGLSQPWLEIVSPRIDRIMTAVGPLDQVEPPAADIFAALRACPDPAAIKVIILGQDPYPTESNAHGLAFSVRPSAKLPASLNNIFKELAADLQTAPPTNGCLQGWADQGVLLLNDVLTVAVGKPQSHSNRGWEELTTAVVAATLSASPHVVFIAWGRTAQKKLEHPTIKNLLEKHTVLTSAHPSPLSARTGFFGSRPFSKTNAALIAHGQTPINFVSSM